MKAFVLCFYLCWAYVITYPTTTTSAPQTTQISNDVNTKLLRQNAFDLLHQDKKPRGRVVIATTHVEGDDKWGVTAEEAETSCQRIAQLSLTSNSKIFFNTASLSTEKEKEVRMVGHLMSFGSSYEVLMLSRLLHPIPDGAFWTGGKVVRYRKHSMHDDSYVDHVLLSWTDGRSPDLSVLGMTKEDKLQLKESYIYCLALNLHNNTWQARDCSDKLPYACLVTPRRMRFSNKANEANEVNSTTNSTKTEEKTKAQKKQKPESAKLMQNDMEEQSTTPIVPVVHEEPIETTLTQETTTEPSTTTPAILSEDLPTTTPLITPATNQETSTTSTMTEEQTTQTTSVSETDTETTTTTTMPTEDSTESEAVDENANED